MTSWVRYLKNFRCLHAALASLLSGLGKRKRKKRMRIKHERLVRVATGITGFESQWHPGHGMYTMTWRVPRAP